MKQQFEVGDKAIWKGGKVSGTIRVIYPVGSEVEITRNIGEAYMAKFHDLEWIVYSDQLEQLPVTTTPTTIVTVHGNPDWKPEKGEQIGWKIIEWFPMEKYKKQSVEECFKVHGYHFGIEHECIEDWSPASNPKHFAPVYKEAKPIEFVKYLNALGEIRPAIGNHIPSKTKRISLISKSYAQMGGAKLDLMIATWPTDTDVLILGHFNSGTI